ILKEDGGRHIGVVEPADFVRMKRIDLRGGPNRPRMPGVRTAHCCFCEVRFMAGTFQRWSELMAQARGHPPPARRNEVFPCKKFSDNACVESPRAKLFPIT